MADPSGMEAAGLRRCCLLCQNDKTSSSGHTRVDELARRLIMSTEIVARAAEFCDGNDNECLTAGFSELPDGSGLALLFQVSTFGPDEQDVQLGWARIAVSPRGTSVGPAMAACSRRHLVGTELSLLFNPETAEYRKLEIT